MKHIYEIWIKYREVIVYLVFGVLTTAVNYMIYLPCYNLLHLSSAVSNALAWVVAVAFAFLTNKPFVFRSYDWRAKVVISELTKFVGARLGSGAMETLILLLTCRMECISIINIKETGVWVRMIFSRWK